MGGGIMSLREKLLMGLVIMGCLYLIVSGRATRNGKSDQEPRLITLATDITDLPKTRFLDDVTDRVMEVRKQELAAKYKIDPKKIYIKVKGETLLNKYDEFYTVTFQLGIKGVPGLYAERYTIRTTKKRVFSLTDVQYDHKCTLGKVMQEWTVEPCDIKVGG